MRGSAVLAGISELIFPRRCALCREQLLDGTLYDVCEFCKSKITVHTGAACTVCAVPMDGELADAGVIKCGRCRIKSPPYDKTIFCLRYKNEVRKLLHLLKFSGREGLVYLFAPMMSSRLYREPERAEIDFVVPVPLHYRRLLRRGFNQSYLLAHEVAVDLTIKMAADVLIRKKDTTAQFAQTRSERFKNIRGAFAVRDAALIKGRKFLLVDDIMTSGATMYEASKTLKKAGARNVYCLVAARA